MLLSNRRSSGTPPKISEEAVKMLEAYPFPGNVRELENVLERAVTLSVEGVIAPEHIRLRASMRPATGETPASTLAVPPLAESTALGSQLESIEREAIVKALEKTRYNKTAAAKLLGMSFRALRYRIKKLGIE
jgi:two-component system, NtrC family, response regulator PilR